MNTLLLFNLPGQESKLGLYVPFNSQGDIRTGPQALPLVGLEPTEVIAYD